MTDDEKREYGRKWAKDLMLRRAAGFSPMRYQTASGTYTALGIFERVCRFVDEMRHEEKHKEAAEKWKFATDMAINEEIANAKDSGKKDDESH
jgi:hypothetical protein